MAQVPGVAALVFSSFPANINPAYSPSRFSSHWGIDLLDSPSHTPCEASELQAGGRVHWDCASYSLKSEGELSSSPRDNTEPPRPAKKIKRG